MKFIKYVGGARYKCLGTSGLDCVAINLFYSVNFVLYYNMTLKHILHKLPVLNFLNLQATCIICNTVIMYDEKQLLDIRNVSLIVVTGSNSHCNQMFRLMKNGQIKNYNISLLNTWRDAYNSQQKLNLALKDNLNKSNVKYLNNDQLFHRKSFIINCHGTSSELITWPMRQ
jgi:hypothetical protein